MLKDGSKLFKNVQETLYVLSPTCISSVWSIDRWMVSTRPEVTDALPSAFDGFNWPILTVWQLGFLFVNNIHEWEQITSIRSLECPRAIRGPDTRLWRIVTYKADAFWFDGCSCKRNSFIIFYNSDNRLDDVGRVIARAGDSKTMRSVHGAPDCPCRRNPMGSCAFHPLIAMCVPSQSCNWTIVAWPGSQAIISILKLIGYIWVYNLKLIHIYIYICSI